MYKENLKQLWGSYCDTDKLVDAMMSLLKKYHHENTVMGVCSLLNTYFENKKPMIDMFMKSDSYIGNMRICLNAELERRSDGHEVDEFCAHFAQRVEAQDVFLKYVDEYGKTLEDYTRVGIGKFKASDLHYRNIAAKLIMNEANKAKFRNDGSTRESYDEFAKFGKMIYNFAINPGPVLQTGTVELLEACKINASFVGGMKTSRAFNRACACYGVDKLPKYNKLFAQYADMVSGLKRKVKFYISLNPLDYLTMSFGNSWSSCHTIDKRNERNMPSSYHGMHCGGTVSYMLDETSFITYVHDHATEDHEEGKIYRNMFHFNEGTLVQGRIYPQGNDGATDLYKEFRRIVQGELTKLLGLNEDSWYKRTTSCSENTASYGVHYPDYLNFSGCNVSYPVEMQNAARNVVHIGHARICTKCGREIDDDCDSGYLTHDDCEDW